METCRNNTVYASPCSSTHIPFETIPSPSSDSFFFFPPSLFLQSIESICAATLDATLVYLSNNDSAYLLCQVYIRLKSLQPGLKGELKLKGGEMRVREMGDAKKGMVSKARVIAISVYF